MYEFTDKAIEQINRTIQREFSKLRRTVLSFDEIWVVQDAVNACYRAIEREVKNLYLDVANAAYKDATGREDAISYLWVEQFLFDYDPVTKYVFAHEFDRKRARTFEAIVSTQRKSDIPKELKQSMQSLSVQTKQYADEITDTATLQGYKDSGVDRVRWITEQDGRVCIDCRKRHGKTYSIDNVPVKPHIRCRCWLVPARQE